MFEPQRKALIHQLRQKGISSHRVLDAMEQVQRHIFVPKAQWHRAYEDSALPIGSGQTISQPYTVAFMTQALEVRQGAKILEIGTGSGYQAAVLLQMGARVFSIERSEPIYFQTRSLFDKLQLNAYLKLGDGTLGIEEFSPYDGIIVTAGGNMVPDPLKKQLAVGGKLVIPVGTLEAQVMHVITKLDLDAFSTETYPDFRFVPLIGKKGWNEK